MSRFRTPANSIEDPTGFDPPIYPQAQVDPVDFDIIDQATAGEGVLNGCEVTAHSPTNLTVDVAVGQIVVDGVIWDVDPTPSLAITTPHVSQARFDLVCAQKSSTTPFIVAGSPAAFSPLFPTGASVLGTSVVLASIYVPHGLSAITSSHLTNKAEHVHLPPAGTSDWTPIRATSDLTRNNTAALAADTVLAFPMANGVKYAVRGEVYISCLQASGVRRGFLGPASPSFFAIKEEETHTGGLANTTETYNVIAAYDTTGRTQTQNVTSYTSIVSFAGIVHNGSNTSPNFAFAWGQSTAVAQNTVRKAGSWLEYVAI